MTATIEAPVKDKLRQEVKDKWVAALRSGEYQQTKSVLNDANGYCCLGVLCDLASKDGVGSWGELRPGSQRKFNGYSAFMPSPEVITWAFGESPYNLDNPESLWGTSVRSPGYARGATLDYLNDGIKMDDGERRSYTFAEIADIIEAEF